MSRKRSRNRKVLSGNAAATSAPETFQRTPQPRIRRWTRKQLGDLELATILQILRKAEEGEVADLADLWNRMLHDDQLASVWETRMSPVFSARWDIEPAPSANSEAATLAAKGCREALLAIPNLPTIFNALLNARGVGFAVCEILWKRGTLLGQPAFVPYDLRPVHPRRFRYADNFEIGLYDNGHAASEMTKLGIDFELIPDAGAPIVRLPAGKYIVHQSVGNTDYPTASGLVHTLARPWWVKQVATKLFLSGAEIAANPRLIGRVDEMATDAVMEEFAENLDALASDGTIVLRPGTNLDIIEGKANSSADVWQSLIDTMNAAISKAVLGSTLNVETGPGSGNRATAESQATTTIRPRQQQDAAQMWATIQRDLFTYIIAYNPHIFGTDCPVPVGRSVLVEERSEIDQLAVDSGAVRVDELRQSRGLPMLGGEQGAAFIAPITRGPQAALYDSLDVNETNSTSEPTEAVTEPSSTPSDEDSAEATADAGAATERVADEALNGAQISSLQGVIQSVSAKQLPAEAAIELIAASFPKLDRAIIERMVNAASRFTPSQEAEV